MVRLLGDRGRQRRTDTSRCWSRCARGRNTRGWRHSRGLPAAIGDRHHVRRVVDHDGIVDVVEDHVVRRWWRYVNRWAHPNGHRAVYGYWQHEEGDRSWWRREQNHELRWPRGKEDKRRRRRLCKRKYRIVENENPALDVDELLRRGWGHLVVDERK